MSEQSTSAAPPGHDVFLAFPAVPDTVGQVIDAAIAKLKEGGRGPRVLPWPEMEVVGRFIDKAVLESIASAQTFAADISYLSFNVTYEIGYAIGRGKRVLLVRNAAIGRSLTAILNVGIFDILGHAPYQNSAELAEILQQFARPFPLLATFARDSVAPLYLLDSKYKTDATIRIISRIKKARLRYRSFDPAEQPRLSADEAIQQVAQSYGVLVQLLPRDHEDSDIHNQRAAFIAGLAQGMGKVLSILRSGDDPVPLDYRDIVVSMRHIGQIDQAIADFAKRVAQAQQDGVGAPKRRSADTLFTRLTLGASTAENETRHLSSYYLETDAFHRARRGEVRLVVGRKGSGKTALFLQLRAAVRVDPDNVVLDLKPEGYQLVKFKEAVADVTSLGTVEHILMALWEYLLLLELCQKVLELDRDRHGRDMSRYQRLAASYQSGALPSDSDFSERIVTLVDEFLERYASHQSGTNRVRLSASEIGALIYRHDVTDLLSALTEYLESKGVVWMLVDNIDKGRSARGLQTEDVLIIRTLLDATRNLERQLQRRGVQSHTIVFLRDDVYELLVKETPDRGKDSRVLVDWTDPDLLRELLRRRLSPGLDPAGPAFEELWRTVCVSHIDGEETSEYIIERSLMRPRFLLDLLSHCRASAVNLRHEQIEVDDIKKALNTHCNDLLTGITFEIRDVLPQAEAILYSFIDSRSQLGDGQLRQIIQTAPDTAGVDVDEVVRTLVWHGFLGLRTPEEVVYIYSPVVHYNMRLFDAMRRKIPVTDTLYVINPAFWPSLKIRP